MLAYTLGLRHAFDADHIAAIDNVVRKLTQEGKQPLSAGLFFSLGHSTVVVLASIVIALMAAEGLDLVKDVGGGMGTAVSALFLLIVGTINLFALDEVWWALRRARTSDQAASSEPAASGGLIVRVLRPLLKITSCSWQMYPIGLLFGLGFDTATEVGLLGISATKATDGLSFWAILIFPLLFTAGMSLMDTIDSVLMSGAYRWAFIDPLRKLRYNFIITAVSVIVAFLIGGIEILGVIGNSQVFHGGAWQTIRNMNAHLVNIGIGVSALLLVVWFFSAVRYRAGTDRHP